MAVYWLTFRLNDDASYSDRYTALVDAVDAVSSTWWVDSTSFFIFESDKKIGPLALKIKPTINQKTDLVLIGMTEFKSYRLIGKTDDETTLQSLLPQMKKA